MTFAENRRRPRLDRFHSRAKLALPVVKPGDIVRAKSGETLRRICDSKTATMRYRRHHVTQHFTFHVHKQCHRLILDLRG